MTVHAQDGTVLSTDGVRHPCRCGGSRSKPFCDATHGLKGWSGPESADHGPIADRREDYPAGVGVTVHDDRTRCAHFGQCTSWLPGVFRTEAEPFVDPAEARGADIAAVVADCPSGVLAYSVDGELVERPGTPSITPTPMGRTGCRGTDVVGADGRPYESRERQTLCRCGHSRNKPFCDGSHSYAGFRDPAQPAAVPSLYEWCGGITALETLTERFYADLLGEPDPVLEPVFRGMDPGHPKHVAAWLGETFGGPATFTAEHGGHEHMVAAHRGLGLTETQRQRWITRLQGTADAVGLPTDPDFRSTFLAYLEWGTRIAVFTASPGSRSSSTPRCRGGVGVRPRPTSRSHGTSPPQPSRAGSGGRSSTPNERRPGPTIGAAVPQPR